MSSALLWVGDAKAPSLNPEGLLPPQWPQRVASSCPTNPPGSLPWCADSLGGAHLAPATLPVRSTQHPSNKTAATLTSRHTAGSRIRTRRSTKGNIFLFFIFSRLFIHFTSQKTLLSSVEEGMGNRHSHLGPWLPRPVSSLKASLNPPCPCHPFP